MTQARSGGERSPHAPFESGLYLRTDYGRVAQQYPIDRSVLQQRPKARDRMLRLATPGGKHIVTGAPGAGKSWALTELADTLRERGAIVTRHYCYLQPGDAQTELRVRQDALLGNLIAGLVDAAPELRESKANRFASTADELERVLEAAASGSDEVVIIIDGLDHIERVRASSQTLSGGETSIVEVLAGLKLPPSVAMLLGSQPGPHLAALLAQGYETTDIPAWSADELLDLQTALGVPASLEGTGEETQQQVMQRIGKFADGNPLCATFLSRELRAIREGGSIGLDDWLAEFPATTGSVDLYYRHLYKSVEGEQRTTAELLALLDFSVSREDIRKLLGALSTARLDETLRRLRPVLADTVVGGGIRIFHESFRRFIAEQLAKAGADPGDHFEPIAEFLEAQGFTDDPRAFRHLLSVTLRAHGPQAVLGFLSCDFIEASVATGQPLSAIWGNLEIFCRAAASASSWPDLVRCSELCRQFESAAEQLEEEGPHYRAGLLALRGPQFVAARLLHDGRPVLDQAEGLRICAEIDKSGGVAPWTEYIPSGLDIDGPGEPDGDPDERLLLARVRGEIRLHGWREAQTRVETLLCAGLSTAFADRALATVGEIAGTDALRDLTQAVARPLPLDVRHRLSVLIAEKGEERPEGPRGSEWAGCASDVVRRWVDLGHEPGSDRCPDRDPGKVALGLAEQTLPTWTDVSEWFARVRLCSRRAPALLDREYERIEGQGWYRSWLRFAIGVAQAEVAPRHARGEAVAASFVELTRDADPFHGSPRAVDLHVVREVIFESLDVAFGLLDAEAHWEEALTQLGHAISLTSATLWNSPWGPLPLEELLALLVHHLSDGSATVPVGRFIHKAIDDAKRDGTYYGYHARHLLYRVQILNSKSSEAEDGWRDSIRFLCAYGHHKDRTLFELLDSTTVLTGAGRKSALAAIAATQTMAEALLDHTDFRSTQGAPSAWFRALADAKLPLALEVLANARHGLDDNISGYVGDAFKACTRRAEPEGSPALVAWCWALVPFDPRSEQDGESLARAKIDSANRVLAPGPKAVLLNVVAAQIADDPRSNNGRALRYVARALRSDVAKLARRSENEDESPSPVKPPDIEVRLSMLFEPPVFPSTDGSQRELSKKLEQLNTNRVFSARGPERVRLANAIGYRLLTLFGLGYEAFVHRFVRDMARDYWTIDQRSLVADLAAGFERHGAGSLACEAYTRAYARSRGDDGWSPIGGVQQEKFLLEAARIDAELAVKTLADEVAEVIIEQPGSIGVTKNLIRRLAALGEGNTAEQMWWAGFEVVDRRIPIRPEEPSVFPRVSAEATESWSVDEGLAALILTELHHPVAYRKRQATFALREVLASDPEPVESAMVWFLGTNCPTSSMLLVLHALDEAGRPASSVLLPTLRSFARGHSWSARTYAQRILSRSETPPRPPQFGALVPPSPPLRRGNKYFARCLDKGSRGILDFMPAGLVWLEHRFDQRLEDKETYLERRKLRARLALGPRGECRPQTPVLPWETEILLGLADQALNHLSTALREEDAQSDSAESDALKLFAPAQTLHVAYLASRRPRGLGTQPVADEWAIGNVPRLVEPGEYDGWSVFGEFENYWCPAKRYLDSPREHRSRFAGICVRSLGDGLPHGCWPLGTPEQLGRLPPQTFFGMPSGPLCVWDVKNDWSGTAELLTLPPGLAAALGIELRMGRGGIRWCDAETGETRAVLRTWFVRDEQQMDAAPLRRFGAELLVSPSVRAELERLVAGSLAYIRSAKTTDVGE